MPRDPSRLFPIGPDPRRRGRARRGFDDTLKAMRTLGRVEDIDAALIALARVAADQLDDAVADTDESRYTVGTMIARYHTVLTHLLARPDSPNDDRDLDALFAALGDHTEPG